MMGPVLSRLNYLYVNSSFKPPLSSQSECIEHVDDMLIEPCWGTFDISMEGADNMIAQVVTQGGIVIVP